MNILFLCHRFPFPPNRGGKIRPFHMIQHLGRSHDVTVASIARSEAEARAGEGLAAHCRRYFMGRVSPGAALARMLARLPTPVPSSMGYFHDPKLAHRVRAALASEAFDLIFVHCSSAAPYVADVTGVPKFLDFGDMDSEKWLAYARERGFPLALGYAIEGRKLRRTERELAAQFDYCSCTTPLEVETFRTRGLGSHVGCIPNGVNCEFFAPSSDPYDPDSIVFLGRVDYYPNIEGVLRFCRDILPRVRAARPRAHLAVVGAEPSRAVRRLARHPGITVTGTVPDVRPYVRRAALAVVPLRIARGTQNKILESMAMGVPVVSSVEASRGVQATPGVHFLTASTPQEFAAAVLRILEDPEERARLAEAGRHFVTRHVTWDASMRTLDALIARCLAAARRQDSVVGPERPIAKT